MPEPVYPEVFAGHGPVPLVRVPDVGVVDSVLAGRRVRVHAACAGGHGAPVLGAQLLREEPGRARHSCVELLTAPPLVPRSKKM